MHIDQLALNHAVFLRALLPSDPKRFAGLSYYAPTTFAASEAYYRYMLDELQRADLLVAEQAVSSAAAGGFARSLRTVRLEFHDWINRDLAGTRQAAEARLEVFRADRSAAPHFLGLWQELGLVETQSYLAWELSAHRFDPVWAEHAASILEQGLFHFSIGQMFYFCWAGVRELASRHLRQPGPLEEYKEHLAAAMEQRMVRALRDGWEVRQYERQWRRRTNVVAETFAQQATRLGDQFLQAVPTEHALASLF